MTRRAPVDVEETDGRTGERRPWRTSSSGPPPVRARLRPGVVTGADYLALLDACQEGGYALPAVNVTGTNTTTPCSRRPPRNRSDVIIQLSNGGAQLLRRPGHPGRHAGEGPRRGLGGSARPHGRGRLRRVRRAPHRPRQPASSCPWVEGLLDHGEEYARLDRAAAVLVAHARPLGGAARGEHRRVRQGAAADGAARHEPRDRARRHRRRGGRRRPRGRGGGGQRPPLHPAGGRAARLRGARRRSATFTIAASFGNVHGVYAPGNVKLRPEILRASQQAVAARARAAARGRSTSSSTAAPGRRRTRSPRRCPTGSSR